MHPSMMTPAERKRAASKKRWNILPKAKAKPKGKHKTIKDKPISRRIKHIFG